MNKYMALALIGLTGFSTFAAASDNAETNTPSSEAENTVTNTPTESTETSAPQAEASKSVSADTTAPEKTEESMANTSTKNTPVNTGKGFYIGLGVGVGSYGVSLTDGDYYIDDDGSNSASNIKGDDLDGLDDSSSTAIDYAGYQFNKIIAVEASYTNHGSYSGEIELNKGFKKNPKSIAVYANAGYTFFNGQLRPFGVLGLAYIDTNQSKAYDLIDVDDTAVAMHIGGGVEYYPTALRGVGFRLAYTADFFTDNSYDTYERRNGDIYIKSTTLWQALDLLYVGVQYKF